MSVLTFVAAVSLYFRPQNERWLYIIHTWNVFLTNTDTVRYWYLFLLVFIKWHSKNIFVWYLFLMTGWPESVNCFYWWDGLRQLITPYIIIQKLEVKLKSFCASWPWLQQCTIYIVFFSLKEVFFSFSETRQWIACKYKK